MRVETDVAAPSVLATDEQWDKGWSATVDGHSVPVTRVDGAFVGVTLNPGHHVVEWHYSAPGLKAGLVLAFLALAMCIAICFEAPAALSRRLRSRREAAAPPT
jgi:uncharacterized membrane protein YfhO